MRCLMSRTNITEECCRGNEEQSTVAVKSREMQRWRAVNCSSEEQGNAAVKAGNCSSEEQGTIALAKNLWKFYLDMFIVAFSMLVKFSCFSIIASGYAPIEKPLYTIAIMGDCLTFVPTTGVSEYVMKVRYNAISLSSRCLTY